MKIGSLFSGYGGLDMAARSVIGGELAWYSDVCKFDKDGNAGHYEPHRGPCRVMAHHHPDVPNLGDITKVDWSQIEPVDVITGGSPCQDLSHAGKRGGMTEGTRSNLWVAMREAIATLRPSLVIWENVGGAASAAADSEVEPCAGCVGDGTGVHLRALGRVVGDLSSLGYVGRVGSLRAADVGSCHSRLRYFLTASDTNGAGQHGTGGADLRTVVSLLPTPRATDGTKGGPNQRGSSGDLMLPSAVTLLPTPAVNDMGASYTPEEWDEWTARMKATHSNGNGHGPSLSVEAKRLLPTPRTKNNENRQSEGYGGEDGNFRGLLHNPERWGQYAPAIARWEALTRPAPAPTMTSTKGNPQLAPTFAEWMMGLPAGWITDVPGLTRNDMLKLCGNGVVPQQAEAALRLLLAREAVAA